MGKPLLREWLWRVGLSAVASSVSALGGEGGELQQSLNPSCDRNKSQFIKPFGVITLTLNP